METYNPWWIGEPDPFYEEWLHGKIKWIPKIIEKLSLKPYSLNFLVGPRQVGKTTALKILIHQLLAKRKPRSIFYYSCDELSDYEDLGEILDNYLSARKTWGIKSSIIMLDEITFVDEWYRALKSRIDMKVFKNDVIIVTGSASIELLAGKERFPGRRGLGRDVYMYPLSFGEYVEHFSNIPARRCRLDNWNLFQECMKANTLFSERLSELFHIYLSTGGFPAPIRERFERGNITYASYKVYLDWVRTDWLRARKSEHIMKEVIAYLLETTPTPISWNTVSKNTSITSPNTAREYIETLEQLMLAKIIYWSTPHGKPDYRKNKKIFFIDPFIYKVLSHYTRTPVEEPAVVEATVTTHLARKYTTYYWRNKTEVDAIAVVSGKTIGFEIKWRKKPPTGRKPLQTNTLDKDKIPIFLATLDLS